ncbi:MAG: hypothetical protein MUE85_18220 [Microscillaceae bacterium]|jgi:hypothetical protein|nr:hypothetical protein [Microscillaceae bacterium]
MLFISNCKIEVKDGKIHSIPYEYEKISITDESRDILDKNLEKLLQNLPNKSEENILNRLNSFIALYHQSHPDAETPLNFIEMVGIEKMIEILETASDRSFELIFDYSMPQQPILKEVLYNNSSDSF